MGVIDGTFESFTAPMLIITKYCENYSEQQSSVGARQENDLVFLFGKQENDVVFFFPL